LTPVIRRAGGGEHCRRFLVLILGAGCASSFTAPLEVVFGRRLGADPLVLAAYVALPGLGVLSVDFFGTRFVPRLDARRALALSLALFGIAEVAIGVAASPAELFPGRVIQGLASGLMLGSLLQGAVRVGQEPEHMVGKSNAAFMAGSVLGGPAGGLTATFLPGTAGYRLSFFVCAAIAIVMCAAVCRSLPALPPLGATVRPRWTLPDLGGVSGVRTALVLGTFGDLLRGSVMSTALPLAGLERHISTAYVGLAIGILSAVDVLALSLAVRAFRRFGTGRCLIAALAVGVGLAVYFAFSSGVAAFLLGAFGLGLVIGTVAMAPQLLLMSLHGDASKGLATFRIASGFGSMAGSTASGAVAAAAGATVTFVGIAGVLAGGVAIVVRAGVAKLDATTATTAILAADQGPLTPAGDAALK
jgi:MFS family permease